MAKTRIDPREMSNMSRSYPRIVNPDCTACKKITPSTVPGTLNRPCRDAAAPKNAAA